MEETIKDQMLWLIRVRSEQEAARLAGEFAHAASEEREAILAELQFEQWLADGCRDCLECR